MEGNISLMRLKVEAYKILFFVTAVFTTLKNAVFTFLYSVAQESPMSSVLVLINFGSTHAANRSGNACYLSFLRESIWAAYHFRDQSCRALILQGYWLRGHYQAYMYTFARFLLGASDSFCRFDIRNQL